MTFLGQHWESSEIRYARTPCHRPVSPASLPVAFIQVAHDCPSSLRYETLLNASRLEVILGLHHEVLQDLGRLQANVALYQTNNGQY